jgi:hypothetical protein
MDIYSLITANPFGSFLIIVIVLVGIYNIIDRIAQAYETKHTNHSSCDCHSWGPENDNKDSKK